MTTVRIEAGTLTAARADRVVSGLLLPYGEVGRTNLGRFSVPRGAFTLPDDVEVLNVNDEHDPSEPRARFLTATDTEGGIVASFRVAAGPEGDKVLAAVEDPDTRPALSVEVKNVVLKAGRAISGKVFGAAFVKAGAFPSAALYAADTPDPPDTSPAPAAEVPQQEEAPAMTETPPAVAEAPATTTTAPEGNLAASAPAGLPAPMRPTPAPTQERTLDTAGDLFAALAHTCSQGGRPAQLLAALDSAIQTDVAPSQQPGWLGEIVASRTYRPRIAPLFAHGDLTALKATGWQFESGKAPGVGNYTGFPTQPPSNEVKVKAVTVNAARIAGAGAVDRAFVDFSTPEFWRGYYRECINSYYRQLDANVEAHALTEGNYTDVEADEVPTGVSTAASYIVDGALAIIETFVPTFALVGVDLYREFLLTRRDDALEYLSTALNLEEGQVEQFRIVPSASLDLAGKVLVGSDEAGTVYELKGSPVRVDTVNIGTGGVETGLFGYWGANTATPAAFALVAPAAD